MAVAKTATNSSPKTSAASAMRRRRVSSQVSRAMRRVACMRSAGSLIVAHDLDEPLFERLAAAAQLVQRDAAADEPARELGQHAFGVRVQAHERAVVRDAAAEGRDAFEQAVVDGADAQLDVERARGVR